MTKDRRRMLFAEFPSESGGTCVQQCTELVRPEQYAAEERRLMNSGAVKVWSLGRGNIQPETWARAAALTKAREAREQLELFAKPRRHHP